MINSWTLPEPLNFDQLKSSLASTLQQFPLNAARLVKITGKNAWGLELANQAIPLTVGSSDLPGPFGAKWRGERDAGMFVFENMEHLLLLIQ